MANINGNLILIKLYYSGTTKLIVGSTSGAIEIASDVIDITTKDSAGWATFMPGRVSGTINVNFLYDPELHSSYMDIIDLFDAWKDGTAMTVYFGQWTENTSRITASSYITSISIDSGKDDVTTVSMTLQLSGAITISINNGDLG